jgi:hypothetical protein
LGYWLVPSRTLPDHASNPASSPLRRCIHDLCLYGIPNHLSLSWMPGGGMEERTGIRSLLPLHSNWISLVFCLEDCSNYSSFAVSCYLGLATTFLLVLFLVAEAEAIKERSEGRRRRRRRDFLVDVVVVVVVVVIVAREYSSSEGIQTCKLISKLYFKSTVNSWHNFASWELRSQEIERSRQFVIHTKS